MRDVRSKLKKERGNDENERGAEHSFEHGVLNIYISNIIR